jgi:hypothetical protein
MKRLSAVLIIGFFFSVFCFAQTQTGNASYNASKSGLTIFHSSITFNAKVKVTNIRNGKEVIVTVDGRIPASDRNRIADISAEAGDAIGMSPTGYTEVRLEELIPQQAAAPSPSAAPAPSVAAIPSPPSPAPQNAPPPVSSPASTGESRIETLQVITQPAAQPQATQYLVVPPSGSAQAQCFPSPFCVVILILLIAALLVLTAILVLLLCMRRIPWRPGFVPWYHPVWFRRRTRYLKKRRN